MTKYEAQAYNRLLKAGMKLYFIKWVHPKNKKSKPKIPRECVITNFKDGVVNYDESGYWTTKAHTRFDANSIYTYKQYNLPKMDTVLDILINRLNRGIVI